MNFKESLVNDLSKVFINTNEFADTHNINGVDVDCVVDKDLTDGLKNPMSNYQREGVFLRQILLFVKVADIEKPVEGERLTLDNELYIVDNVSEDNGLLEIHLSRNDY